MGMHVNELLLGIALVLLIVLCVPRVGTIEDLFEDLW